MVEECAKCGKFHNTNFVKVIDKEEIITLCEECANKENLPVLSKPTDNQLEEAEKPDSVYKRLSRMAGLKDREENKTSKLSGEGLTGAKVRGITLDTLRARMNEKYGLKDEPFKGVSKAPQDSNLIDNFHWEIQRGRRLKKLPLKTVAVDINESEANLRMIEAGQLPENYQTLINKLEAYLSIRLRKKLESNLPKQTTSDSRKELGFDKNNLNKLTISDLREIAKKKKEAEENKETNLEGKEEAESLSWHSTQVLDSGELVVEDDTSNIKDEPSTPRGKSYDELVGEEVEFIDEEVKEDE